MIFAAAPLLLLGRVAVAAPSSGSDAKLQARQGDCPPIHVFGARETTAPAGFGSAGAVVDLILGENPGATSEAIEYPACGGQPDCGGVEYGASVAQGTAAVAEAVNAFNEQCPDSEIVLVGYSQGGQIVDNAYCGGGDDNSGITDPSIPISESAQAMIRAAIMMGNPRHVPGLTYNVGTCQASGCPYADNIQSYCDSPDPYCCDGSDESVHQGYGSVYGQDALTFVNGQLSG